MTPEERALRVVEKMREPFANSPAVALLTLIASAIREAQASARDDALEDAAREINMTILANIDEGSTDYVAALGHASERIRSLKAKG